MHPGGDGMSDIELTPEALIADAPTATLVDMLRLLDELERPRGAAERRTEALISGELERRYPVVTDALNAWTHDLESELSYSDALIAALPAEALA